MQLRLSRFKEAVAADDISRTTGIHPVCLTVDERDREGDVRVVELVGCGERGMGVQSHVMLLEECDGARCLPQQDLEEVLDEGFELDLVRDFLHVSGVPTEPLPALLFTAHLQDAEWSDCAPKHRRDSNCPLRRTSSSHEALLAQAEVFRSILDTERGEQEQLPDVLRVEGSIGSK